MLFANTVVVLLVCVLTLQVINARNISLIISLPLHGEPQTSRGRGFEILPGALVAVSGINENSSVLPGHNLEVIVIDSSRHEYEVVQQFIDVTFHEMKRNIVGLCGFLSPKAISLLLPLVRRKEMLLSAITDFTNQKDRNGVPSATINAALISFMKRMNWKQIGLIAETSDVYFFSVAEMLLLRAETNDISISPFIQMFHVTSAVHEIIDRNTRIIFVSVNIKKAVELICVLFKERLLWPDYVWIFHSYAVEDFLDQQAMCDIQNALDGIIIIDNYFPSVYEYKQLISGITFSSYYKQYLSKLSAVALKYNVTLRENRYAKLLYDLVWATAIALNKSCGHQNNACARQVNATAAQEFYQRHDCILKIFIIQNLTSVLISTVYCNSSVAEVSLDHSVLVNAPTDKVSTPNTDPPLEYTVGVAFQIVLITLFVTLIFILYILFHNEPEIKATSFTLSLLVFAGCYLNLVYLTLLCYSNNSINLEINKVSDDAVCIFLQLLSAPGITLPLMLAILLVKMLRVYHIFHSGYPRLGRYCSDAALTCYILLILSPDILVNIIWIIVDRYKIQGGYVHMVKSCSSKHQVVWFGILTVYLLILILALAIVAVITRRVRLQHFKDTKKVNILLFILCLGIAITFSYWVLLQTLETKRYIANLPLLIGHSVLVISFITLLFVPKVLPPLCRFVKIKLS